jgi:hypothetical protein
MFELYFTATIVTSLKKYLEKCLQHGTLTLSLLDKIEEKITEESKFPSFADEIRTHNISGDSHRLHR